MKRVILPFMFSVVVLASGCVTHTNNTASAPLQVRLNANELKADVAVGEKIAGQGRMVYLLGLWALPGSSDKFATGVQYDGSVITHGAILPHTSGEATWIPFIETSLIEHRAVAAATHDALTKSSADVIIAPRYELEKQNYILFSIHEAKVSGYKGTIKSIK